MNLYDIFSRHSQISTDSRQLSPGCIFFALKGERFDGNQFALQALKNGASLAVVDDVALAAKHASEKRLLLVPDVLKALQELATEHRRHFDIPVIGIAGSNGKTTTKELVGAVLSSHYRCHVTKGNLNNHIGVPLTLLAMPPQTEVAVIEIGANHPGEVAALCKIARPTHGLLTNIGKEHLEGFGNLEGVKQAEGELYQYLAAHHGLAFVNRDEKYLTQLSSIVKRRIFYKQSDAPNPKVVDLETQLSDQNPFLKVAFLAEHGKLIEVQTQLYGRHNFQNIQTAIALGRYFKVPSEKIKSALESYQPKNNRSQWVRLQSNIVLMDAYNANPSSMEAALKTLAELTAHPKWAFLGDMLELGNASAAEHRRIFRLAKKLSLCKLIFVGKEFSKLDKYATADILFLPDAEAARQWWLQNTPSNTLILVKGSRGIRLEKIFENEISPG